MEDKILLEKDGALGWIVFNRPEKRNALNLAMWKTIPDYINELNFDTNIRVILFRGAGNEAFVAGADISEFEELRGNVESGKMYNETTENAFRAIRNSAKPVIAMIRGFCIGGGCAIALNCDLRIAADDATFAIPPAKLGLSYGYENVQQVINVIGAAYAKEMLYTARTYHADEALRIGLIHQKVYVDELREYTNKYARNIAQNAPLSISAVKIAINEHLKSPDNRDLVKIDNAMNLCFDSEDYKEGYTAFLEKRKPAFKGK
ncbi:MAG: enoyl-CoA hydratase/isomerase family protein [Leptospiraceae bacterium]|nr:enoyl-CoA hydratase/isomerase family protein [Leptospiraceae bacterium]